MASPVTGPFSKTTTIEKWITGTTLVPRATARQTWYRQKKPYDLPLPYEMTYARMQTYQSCGINNLGVSSGRASSKDWSDPDIASVYNKAYSRLLSKIKEDQAEMGATLAEFRKTADMVNDRCLQLFQFARAVRRGRFREANGLLRIPRNFRPKARNASGAFLEYSFGWAPTVGDIYNGMKILTNGVPPCWAFARAGGLTRTSISTLGSRPSFIRYTDLPGPIRVMLGCRVNLTNPNLWLANQLGLINPIAVAWELVPFSFVVDYFVNVGDVINSWSDFFGVELLRPYRTFVVEYDTLVYNESGTVTSGACFGNNGGEIPNVSWYRFTEHSAKMKRDQGIPGPSLRFTAPRVSLTRASTSIALLLQQLKGKR